MAALAIVGRSPSLRCAFVSQLVTNVIDADKLDYMFRDSFVTRVPLGVDLERLLYKLKCVSVDTHKLPGRLKNMSVDGTTAWVLGTDVAGLRLVYDLAVARSMLFDRIYLHHKTRAAERVALKIFERLALHPLELAARFGLIFGRSAADYAKISLAALNQRKRDLETATPSLYERDVRLRPTSQTLTRPEIGQRIEALSDKLHQYHSHAEVKITHTHVRGFLDQFPETLVEPALKMLEAIRFVDRDDLGKRFLEWLEGQVPRDAVLVPLTTAFEKSAAHMTYYFPDTAITRPVLPLNQALHTEAPLVLFDDVLLSGTQACDVVRAWFGDQQQLYEDLGGPLAEIERAGLVGREVQFRFVYGYAPGIERLRAVVEEKQLGGDIAALRYHDEQKPLDDSIERNDELRTYLRKVGLALLKSTKGVEDPERWNTKRCAERALGYGNDEQLVVLPYNTPTGTITALWKSGTFGNAPWLPLVPRRGELGDAE